MDVTEIEELARQIFVALNRRERKFTEILAARLKREHHTLQQCFVRCIVEVLGELAGAQSVDPRKQESVPKQTESIRKISLEQSMMP